MEKQQQKPALTIEAEWWREDGEEGVSEICIYEGASQVCRVLTSVDFPCADEEDALPFDMERLALAYKFVGSEKMYDALDSIRQICAQNIPPIRRIQLIAEEAERAMDAARMHPQAEGYPIQPCDINTADRWAMTETFGSMEMEGSALWVVRFCQHEGSWEEFSVASLMAYYAECSRGASFLFNGLERGWLERVEMEGGISGIRVTDRFVRQCHKAAPTVLPAPPEAPL